MKLKVACVASALIVIVAFLLAGYGHSDIGRYILFPGLILKVMITKNVHGGGFLSGTVISVASWLVWSFVLYLGWATVSKIPRKKHLSKGADEKASLTPDRGG